MSDGDGSTTAAPDTGAKASTSGRAAMLLGVLWIAGAYATFLRYNAYPLWRLDVLAGMALLAVGPIAIGWIYGQLGRVARACLLGLFAYVVLATNDAGHHWALTGGIAVGIASYFVEAVVMGFATVMAAVVLAWPLLGLSERNPPIRTEGSPQSVSTPGGPPPIIHLILDEHGGKPAFDQIDRHAPGTWAAVEKTYLEQGFSVWRNAYSRHSSTIYSIPEQLGMTSSRWVEGYPRYAPGRLAIIDEMKRANYRVQLLQSSDMDLCYGNGVASCTTYSYAALDQIEKLAFQDRVLFLLSAFIFRSRVSTRISEAYHGLAADLREDGWRAPIITVDWLATPAALNTKVAFDALAKRASRLGSGDALVAHLLLPHFPTSYDERCRLKPFGSWQNRLSNRGPADRGKAYAEQTMCTAELVGRVITAASPQTIVVIHSDHGPRISERTPSANRASRTTNEQFATSYSTLFAVRFPGQQPRVELAQKPVSMLLAELAESRWQKLPSLPPPTRPMVMLHHPEPDRMVEAQLPDWNTPAPTDSPTR